MWHEKYLHLEYTDYNCARLLQKVWLDEFNFKLNVKTNEKDINIYSQEMISQASGLIEIDKPIDKCAVLMYSRSGMVGHVGLWVNIDKGYILHAHKDYGTAILQPAEQVLALNKLKGYYKCNNSI